MEPKRKKFGIKTETFSETCKYMIYCFQYSNSSFQANLSTLFNILIWRFLNALIKDKSYPFKPWQGNSKNSSDDQKSRHSVKTVAHLRTQKEKKYGIESLLFRNLEIRFDVWNRCWKDKQATISTQKGQKL